MRNTVIAALLASSVAKLSCAGELLDLGVLPGAASMQAKGLSADGQVVIGDAFAVDGASQAFRWTRATGLLSLTAAGQGSSNAYACSADGSVIVGQGGNRAFRWTAAGGSQTLGVLTDYESYQGFPHNVSTSTCVSASGSLVAGLSYYSGAGAAKPFVWSVSSGQMASPNVSLNGSTSSETHTVYDMSADGSVLVGFNNYLGAFRATAGGTQLLVRPNGEPGWGSVSQALAVSDDGSVVVGFSGARAFRWTSSMKMIELGHLPGAMSSVAHATNGDGSVVVGTSGNRAFLWTRSAGMSELLPLLAAAGVDVSGWSLEVAHAVSADGTSIAGWGTCAGQQRAFVATGVPMPPPPCSSADLFPDSQINGADLGILLSQWGPATEATISDINRDGDVSGADLGILLANWGPCPN